LGLGVKGFTSRKGEQTSKDTARRQAHDDLALAEYKEGIYDKITPDDSLKRE